MRHADAKICVVTGATSGIGAACARRFAAEGWCVAINAFPGGDLGEARELERMCRAAGGQAMVIEADVRRDADVVRMAALTVDAWGHVDALINSAGTTRFVAHADLHALELDDFLDLYAVNVAGAFLATRACAPSLRLRNGAVLNISSLAGSTGTGSSLAYAASKGALNTLTLSLARALSPQIRVNAIAPGLVDGGLPSRVLALDEYTQLRRRLETSAPLRRTCTADEVAAWLTHSSRTRPA